MSRTVFAGLTALLIAIPSVGQAQAPSGHLRELLSDAASKALIDRRIEVIKAALSLTPDQTKLWPPVEDAIRNRLTMRHQRLATLAAGRDTVGSGTVGSGEFNPIAAVRARAEALSHRAVALKALADAWQPLQSSLDDSQKMRLRFLTLFVLREMRDAVESRRVDAEELDHEEDHDF